MDWTNISASPEFWEIILQYVAPLVVTLLLSALGAYGLRWVIDLLLRPVWEAVRGRFDEATDTDLQKLSKKTGIPIEILLKMVALIDEAVKPEEGQPIPERPQ